MKNSQNGFLKSFLEYEYMHFYRAGSTGKEGKLCVQFLWEPTLRDEQGSLLKSACIFQRNKSICLCHCLLRKCYREEYLMQYIPIYLYLRDILLNIKANGKIRCIRGVLSLRGRFITELSLTTERIHRLECHTITHC